MVNLHTTHDDKSTCQIFVQTIKKIFTNYSSTFRSVCHPLLEADENILLPSPILTTSKINQ